MQWQGLEVPQLEGFTGFVPPVGTGTYKVALIGEAPGEQEAQYGQPFYESAPAGAVLSRLLRRAGLERDGFVISNAVWSRPPANYLEGARYEGEAISRYLPFRDRLFEIYRPRVLVALGNVALKTLTGFGGKGATITNVAGYVLDGPYDGTHVIGTYHPSYIMRGKSELSGVAIWAMQRAIDIARNGFVRTPTRYVTHPSLDDALEFERGYNPDRHFLSYDIETLESSSLDEEEVEEKDEDISFTITRISLCYEAKEGFAISIPWQQPYIDIAKRLLSSAGPKRVWNGNFDNPRLSAAGSPVGGRIYDSMWAWKFLQPTLPRSLGFVAPFYNWTGEPWKHTSDSEPERYSCQDAHALQMIADGVDEHLKQKGQWHVYERHVVHLGEVLTRMSQNGLPYSKEKAEAFGAELQAKWDERFAELQARVPESLKPSKQKTGYKKEPKDTTGLVQRQFYELDETMTPQLVMRWCKLEPFLPTSPLQVRELIKHFGHKVGTNRKTKKDTSDDETIRKIIKKCRGSKKPRDIELGELLTMVRECRQLSKVMGTYVKGWRPGPDGRVHATPGHWGKMFRVSWRRPNISATIQDKTEDYIAQGFRKCVSAPTGRVLLESDWKGIEAVLVGWFANDPEYMRLARLGVHDYMGIYMAGGTVDLSCDDAALRTLFKQFKREHPKLRDDAKHTVHGCLSGDHQVLTENGWVRFDAYDFKSPIAQWDMLNKTVIFKAPKDHVAAPWHGEIMEARGRAVSFNATPDHAFPARKGKNYYERVPAASLDHTHRIPVAGCYEFPASVQCDVRLAAAVQADSALYGHHAVFHLVKPRKIERLRMMLAERGLQSSDEPCRCHRNGRRIRVRIPDLPILSGKLFNENVLKLSKSDAHALLDEVIHWDGTQKENHYKVYLTTEYSNASWIQTLVHLLGREALLRHRVKKPQHKSYGTKPLYEVRFNRRFEARVGSLDLKKYPFRGTVYCVTTDTGYFLARHNNRIFVSGNTNYGMGPRLMADMYELTEKRAKELQGLYFELFPKVREWQRSVLDRASRECKLRNPFGYEMSFWEVYKWDSKYKRWTLGEDAKSAIAFLPRDTAAAMLKEVLLRLRWLADEGIMLASTHDSITCEVDVPDLERIASIVKREMERPVKELNDLSIGVELKAGSAWHGDSMEVLELSDEAVATTPVAGQGIATLSAPA